jgi:hypothetical protein
MLPDHKLNQMFENCHPLSRHTADRNLPCDQIAEAVCLSLRAVAMAPYHSFQNRLDEHTPDKISLQALYLLIRNL